MELIEAIFVIGYICGVFGSKDEIQVPSTKATALGFSKVLVGLGVNQRPIADCEIIDLMSSETTCQKPEDYPFQDEETLGGLGFEDKPLFCGGLHNTESCQTFENGAWKSSGTLNHKRRSFAMTTSPFQDGSSKLFVTGGYGSSYLASSEVLTDNGWQLSAPLPANISYHCMSMVNSSTVIVVGGKLIHEDSHSTFFFNSETNIWSVGPNMISYRSSPSCGLIKKDSETEDKVVIVVGGYSNHRLSSVEVLEPNSDAWREGPELPFGIYYAQLVEDPFGGVVLIGGYGDDRVLDTLYTLPHAESDATWKLMPQKLKTPRYNFAATLIPDEIALCN